MTATTGRPTGRPKKTSIKAKNNSQIDDIPAPPNTLKTALAKKEWERIWTIGDWLNPKTHYSIAKLYCEALEDVERWKRELVFLRKLSKDAYGFELSSYQQANGSWALYAQEKAVQDGRAKMFAYLSEMKMTPSTEIEDSSGEEWLEAVMKQAR